MKKSHKIGKICPVCGKTYYIWPSEENKYKYCSVDCRKLSHRVYKKCVECGKEYFVYKDKNTSIYCSKECEHKHDQNTLITKTCPNCRKEFKVRKCEDKKYVYCSFECRKLASRMDYKCDYCGKIFSVLKSKVEKNKTGVYCCHECSEKATIKGKYVKCNNCGKLVYKSKSVLEKYNNSFCSEDCMKEYNKNNALLISKYCEYCGQIYTIPRTRDKTSRFCSNACKNKWQSENNVGESNSLYKKVSIVCDYCGKEILVSPYRIDASNKHFCSYDCTHNYYKILENRTEKQRAADKSIIYKVNPTLTKPHRDILDLLDEHNILYEIEYIVGYYKLDIYLPKYNLGIEIQGDFWHCSPIKYNQVEYTQQMHGISNDKTKHTYVKRYGKYELLYLWETDIINDIDLCWLIVNMYISSKGILPNYHSFNYDSFGEKLVLKENLIKPYSEMTQKQLQSLISIKNAS